jgi:hypothetical protein
LRCEWQDFPFSLGGEVDKGGHPHFKNGPYAKAKPDFLVHVPGTMEANLACIEVKPFGRPVGTTPLTPVVAIKYKVGAETDPREWGGGGEDEFVSRVSVFDTHCAAVYLTEKTDVAFRPFGLDLFDKLVKACKAIRARLESEQRALGANAIATLQAAIPEGTAVASFLASVRSLTKLEAVETLARLSAEEEARLDGLPV